MTTFWLLGTAARRAANSKWETRDCSTAGPARGQPHLSYSIPDVRNNIRLSLQLPPPPYGVRLKSKVRDAPAPSCPQRSLFSITTALSGGAQPWGCRSRAERAGCFAIVQEQEQLQPSWEHSCPDALLPFPALALCPLQPFPVTLRSPAEAGGRRRRREIASK